MNDQNLLFQSRRRKLRRKLPIAVIIAAMLAIFGGFVTIQGLASASVTSMVGHDDKIPDNILNAEYRWGNDKWPDPVYGKPAGAWPTSAVVVSTQIGIAWPFATQVVQRQINGGGTYKDNDQQLTNYLLNQLTSACSGPQNNTFNFNEYDVNDRDKGAFRDDQRLVRATSACFPGHSWLFFTTDHYANFTEI